MPFCKSLKTVRRMQRSFQIGNVRLMHASSATIVWVFDDKIKYVVVKIAKWCRCLQFLMEGCQRLVSNWLNLKVSFSRNNEYSIVK